MEAQLGFLQELFSYLALLFTNLWELINDLIAGL